MSRTAPAPALPVSSMTPGRLAGLAADRLALAAEDAAAVVRERVGWLRWAILQPAWKVLTSPDVLADLAEIAIEVAILELAPETTPLLEASVPLATRLVEDPARLRHLADVLALLHTTEFSEASQTIHDALMAALHEHPNQPSQTLELNHAPEPQ